MGKESLTPLNVWQELIHLLFSQLCLYYYAEISKEHDYGMHSIYQTDKDIISPEIIGSLG